MNKGRRWYDNDPTLKEALELLSISSDKTKNLAADFILELQEQVAQDVIDHIYETMKKYGDGKGNRWYDSDPVMMKAIELLRVAPPHVQIPAAKKLLEALSKNDFDTVDLNTIED